MALQLAERGFFCREMNVGWKEWLERKHATHEGSTDGVKCSCAVLF